MRHHFLAGIACSFFTAMCFSGTRLTPEQFGAKGDGIADDTRHIQQCIDQISAMAADENGDKGSVVLDKTYYVTRQVPVFDDTSAEHKLKVGPHHRVFHVPSGVTIEGTGTVTLLQGGQSSRDNLASYTYVFWVAKSPDSIVTASDPATEEDRVRDVTIRGIAILNDPASLYPPYSETSAVMVKHGRNIRIENTRFRHWHRAVAMTRPVDSSVIGCTIEDTRYIGVAIYGALGTDKERCRVTGNTLRGNTQLSGGIYVGGVNVDVTDNQLAFTHGIFAEALTASTIGNNRISRAPHGIRAGYLAGGGVNDVTVTDNTLDGCVAGIMLGNASDVSVERNVIRGFIAPGSDIMIEPPNGYWGFGRERVGINVEDSYKVRVADNEIAGLNEGAPIGIRVSNSRFTTDFARGCYSVTTDSSAQGNHWNAGNQIIGNRVTAESGLKISYYIENQSDCVLKDNIATGDSGGRVIASTGKFDGNRLAGLLRVADEASPECRRLVTWTHPMHWDGLPVGDCRFAAPAPAYNEYFPPIPSQEN